MPPQPPISEPSSEQSVAKAIQEAEAKFGRYAGRRSATPTLITGNELLKSAITTVEEAFQSKMGESRSRIRTGILDIDRKLCGMVRGDYILLVGREDLDPTVVALNLLIGMTAYLQRSGTGETPLYCSLAKSPQRVRERLLSIVTDFQLRNLALGLVKTNAFPELLTTVADKQASVGFRVADCTNFELADLRTTIMERVGDTPPGIIFVDSLDCLRFGNQTYRPVVQAEIARTLKQIARETESVVIGLARAIRSRNSFARLTMQDVHTAGYVTADADLVVATFCEGHWLCREEPVRTDAETDDQFNTRYQIWQSRISDIHELCELLVLQNLHDFEGTIGLKYKHSTGTLTIRDDESY